MPPKPWPVLDPCLFKDVDLDGFDFEAQADFVIVRVFVRGDVQDIRNCRRYYEDERVTEALLRASHLPWRTLHLVSAICGKPIEQFDSYWSYAALDPDLRR